MNAPALEQKEKPFTGTDHSISFENVRFAYKENEVLHGVSLTVPESSLTALPWLKGLNQVAAQVRTLVDGMTTGPFKFDVGGLGGAAEGGHQQLSIRLVGIADIVNGHFQR